MDFQLGEHDIVQPDLVFVSHTCRYAVPEYWIVFQDDHQLLHLVLADRVYVETRCDTEVVMSVEPHARVDLQKVW